MPFTKNLVTLFEANDNPESVLNFVKANTLKPLSQREVIRNII
jgi:hypothetical protein